MDILLYQKTVILVLAGLFGLCIGSFLNVVIYRVPLKMSVAFPPSHCPKCDYRLKWYDNIPVISYIMLKGKCRSCHTHISFRYTAVELANTLLWLLSAVLYIDRPIYAAITAILMSVLLCVFFIDLENLFIPDRFQVILLCLGIASTVFGSGEYSGGKNFLSNIIGGVAGFLIMLAVSLIGSKVKGEEALGGGDVKLVGCMGLFLGWQKLIIAVLLASFVGSIVMIALSKKAKEKDKQFPFAPFLTSGFAVAVFFGDIILDSYLNMILI